MRGGIALQYEVFLKAARLALSLSLTHLLYLQRTVSLKNPLNLTRLHGKKMF